MKNVSDIRDLWLCHGCGMCQAVCKQNAIRMDYQETYGNYVPVMEREKCNQCGLCLEVCPGHEVLFSRLSGRFLNADKLHLLAGRWKEIYFGWATDNVTRRKASSGGVATALGKFLLDRRRVDSVLVVKAKGHCLNFQGSLVENSVDLLEAMGSKYCSATLCSPLADIRAGSKIAVFGLPCHIQAIRKAQEATKFFDKIDFLLIGIFCGGTKTREATEWVIRTRGFKLRDLVSITYRGDGWPGKLNAVFSDGKVLNIPYRDYAKLQFQSFTPWRCKMCSDGLAELADLSIGDAWLKDIVSNDDQGTSIVISRSTKGEEILQEAKSSCVINLYPAKEGDPIKSQEALLINKKINVKGYFLAARLTGRGIPTYDNIVKETSRASLAQCLKREMLYFVGRFISKHVLFNKMIPISKRMD